MSFNDPELLAWTPYLRRWLRRINCPLTTEQLPLRPRAKRRDKCPSFNMVLTLHITVELVKIRHFIGQVFWKMAVLTAGVTLKDRKATVHRRIRKPRKKLFMNMNIKNSTKLPPPPKNIVETSITIKQLKKLTPPPKHRGEQKTKSLSCDIAKLRPSVKHRKFHHEDV